MPSYTYDDLKMFVEKYEQKYYVDKMSCEDLLFELYEIEEDF